MVATTFLFIASAVLLTLAGREPKAATVFGGALISGAVTLAMFLSERQGRTLQAVRRLRESAPTDTRSAYRYVRHLTHKLKRKPEGDPTYTLRRAD